MAKPDPTDRQYLDRFLASYREFKAPYFREYQAKPTDVKRLWALVLNSPWRGSGIERMERLLTLWPLAVEMAARTVAFPATTGIWHLAQSAEGIERLSGGIVPGTIDEVKQYARQVVRVRLESGQIAL